jgi:hypothetical protein
MDPTIGMFNHGRKHAIAPTVAAIAIDKLWLEIHPRAGARAAEPEPPAGEPAVAAGCPADGGAACAFMANANGACVSSAFHSSAPTARTMTRGMPPALIRSITEASRKGPNVLAPS